MSQGKFWSKEEDAYLLDYYGTIPLASIGRKLDRPTEGCRVRYYRLTGTHDALIDTALSTEFVGEVLGVTRVTINNWIRECNFPSVKFYKERTDAKKNVSRRNFIAGDKVWDWVKKNQERVNFSQIKLGLILPEPDWLTKAVIEARGNGKMKRPVPWTSQEKEYLLYAYFILEHSTQEISEHLQRKLKGVCDKLFYLRKELEAEGYVFSRLKGRIVIKSIPEGKKHLIKMAG